LSIFYNLFVLDKAKAKNMSVSDSMVFKIRVGRKGFFFFKPTSMLLPLKSHKFVCFFLTTAYYLFDMQYNVFVITCVYSPFFISIVEV
jgi:hypothetical protein